MFAWFLNKSLFSGTSGFPTRTATIIIMSSTWTRSEWENRSNINSASLQTLSHSFQRLRLVNINYYIPSTYLPTILFITENQQQHIYFGTMLYLNLIIFSLALAFIFKTSHQQMTYGACLNDGSNPDQTLGCEPRDMLIKLDLPNNSYFHVSPEHVTVQRCGGSCNLVER